MMNESIIFGRFILWSSLNKQQGERKKELELSLKQAYTPCEKSANFSLASSFFEYSRALDISGAIDENGNVADNASTRRRHIA